MSNMLNSHCCGPAERRPRPPNSRIGFFGGVVSPTLSGSVCRHGGGATFEAARPGVRWLLARAWRDAVHWAFPRARQPVAVWRGQRPRSVSDVRQRAGARRRRQRHVERA